MNTRLNGKTVSDMGGKQMSVGQERTDVEIISDMLRAGETGSGEMGIMYTADMSYPQIQKYLKHLIKEGFISKVNFDDTMVVYQVTESGLKFLKAIDTVLNMIESTPDSD